MNEIRRTLYQRLTGDAALTAMLAAPDAVYHAVAPQTASTPFVVFHKQSGTPDWQFAGAHIQDDVWTVKAVDQRSTASTTEDIAARIDALLNDAPLTITGRLRLGVYRQSDLDYLETEGADTYRHVGAMYRLVTQPA